MCYNMKSALILALLVVLAFVGCGNPNLGQVSGIVTYDGQPLENATVIFIPQGPEGVLGVAQTDENGKYIMSSPLKKNVTEGVLAGEYNVTITKKEKIVDADQILYNEGKISYDELNERQSKKDIDVQAKSLIPTRYDSIETSGLTAEVQAKTENVFNFELTK